MKNIFSRNNGKSERDGLRSLHHFIDETATVKIEPLAKTEPTPEPKEEAKEEWIWVEGYKGTDKDMKCRGYQYEIGGGYHIDDDKEIAVCENGFHLCLKLEDVFEYYNPGNGNRYFKVKALVRKEDYEKYGTLYKPTITYDMYGHTVSYSNPWASKIDKLAAREIIFLEEVPTYELYAHIRVKYEELKKAPDEVIKKAVETSVEEALNDYKIITLIEDGYSEAFANYLIKRDSSKFDKAHMLAAENLSMDVRVLTLMLG